MEDGNDGAQTRLSRVEGIEIDESEIKDQQMMEGYLSNQSPPNEIKGDYS